MRRRQFLYGQSRTLAGIGRRLEPGLKQENEIRRSHLFITAIMVIKKLLHVDYFRSSNRDYIEKIFETRSERETSVRETMLEADGDFHFGCFDTEE